MIRITIIDRDQPGGVGELAGELQQDAERRLVLAMIDEQLAGHQAAPRERPALLQAADERRQRGRQHDVAVAASSRCAPSTRPARSRIGGMLSMPAIRPLAIDGAAPSTTTNRIAASRQLEQQDREREPRDRRHRLQAGDERADRRAQRRLIARHERRRRSPPMTSASAKPDERPLQRDADRRRRRAVGRARRQSSGRPCPAAAARTRASSPSTPRAARAASDERRSRPSFGQVADQIRRGQSARCARRQLERVEPGQLLVEPAVASRSASIAGMAAHLLAQLSVIVGGERGAPRASRCGGAARCRRRTRRRRGPGRLDSSTTRSAEAGRLAHVVGDEHAR